MFTHPFPNFPLGPVTMHSLVVTLLLPFFVLFISSGFASVCLIRVRMESVRGMGSHESENSYLHKNANSTIVALSGKMVGFHQWSA